MKYLILFFLLTALPAHAMRVIIGHPPGGSQDLIVRSIAKASGNTLTPEYRPGAGGHRALAHAARQKPDGDTVIIASSSIISGQFFHRNIGYTPQDFVPIAYIGEADNVLLIHPSVPARSVRELLHLAQTKDVSFGYGGMSTNSYVGMVRMLRLGGAKMHAVSYKSSTDAPPDLVRGDIDTLLLPTPVAATTFFHHIERGRMRAIATSGINRSSRFTGLPTIGETFPGYSSFIWWAFFVPAGTSDSDVISLRHLFDSGIHKARDQLAASGVDSRSMTPDQLRKFLRNEYAAWVALDRLLKFPRNEL